LHSSSGNAHLHMTTTSSGSTASDGLTVFADASLAGLWYREAGALQFATNSAERMRIDSSGNVGIGTSSPDKNLHIEAEPPVFRMTNPQGTSSLGLSMGKIEWETRDSSASGVIAHIDVVDSNNFGTTFDMAFATGQSGSATERMRIDSSGNTTFKANNSAVGPIVTLENTATAVNGQAWGSIHFKSNDTSTNASGTRASIVGTSTSFNGDGNLVFSTAPSNGSNTERMRIDSSGNLLVGTTDNTPYNNSGSGNDGLALHSGGFISAARTDNAPAIFNRLNSDGKIVELRKDGGTVVGSIGTSNSYIYIGEGDVGLAFRGASDYILPWNPSTNSTRDNAINIGDSAYRFKDLYLSGGVYLGGTGSANKLDDYEEGTFSPVMEGSTSGTFTSTNLGRYTKIGRSVSIQLTFNNLVYNAVVGNLKITGLPYATDTTNAVDLYVPVQVYRLDWPSDAEQIYAFQNSSNSTQLELFYSRDSNVSAALSGTNLAGTYFRMTWTYNTPS